MSRNICFEPVAGAAGDMILASLFDLGVNPEDVARVIRSGGLHDFQIHFERRPARHGIMCGFVTVITDDHDQARTQNGHTHGKTHQRDAGNEPSHAHQDDQPHGQAKPHTHDQEGAHGHAHTHANPQQHHEHRHEHEHQHPHDHGLTPEKKHSHANAHAHEHDRSAAHEHSHKHQHRGLKDILAMIHRSHASARAKERAERIFRRLGQAEAAVHGVGIEDIHFHEVGAVDSIVDIFGIAIALDILDIDQVFCTGFMIGRGTVRCAHGIMPVPAPATAKLLEGQPVTRLPIDSELTTPTGAAVLTALSQGTCDGIPFVLLKTGNGHGTREFNERPNMIRAHLLDCTEAAPFERGAVSVMQCDVDDQSGEVTGALMDSLFAAGALDVNLSPVQMKKNRPGIRLTVLCKPGAEDQLGQIVLSHSSSIGLRLWSASRLTLRRGRQAVETPWGMVRCKQIQRPDGLELTPEFDSAREVAEAAGIPVRHVMDAARRWTPNPK